MKKLCILTLAIALLLPLNVSAYTTFIAADQSVADESDLIGLNLIDSDLPASAVPFSTYGTSTLSFDGTEEQALPVSSPLQFALYDTGTGAHGFTWTSGAISSPGVLFSYFDGETSDFAPILDSSLLSSAGDPGKYTIDLTYEFTGFTVDGSSALTDGGALYTVTAVPVPSAILLLAPGLLAFFGLRRKITG